MWCTFQVRVGVLASDMIDSAREIGLIDYRRRGHWRMSAPSQLALGKRNEAIIGKVNLSYDLTGAYW